MADTDLSQIAFEIEVAVIEQSLILGFFFQPIQPMQDRIEFVSMAFADEFCQKMTFEIADATMASLSRSRLFSQRSIWRRSSG